MADKNNTASIKYILKAENDLKSLQDAIKKQEAIVNRAQQRIANGDKRYTQEALEKKTQVLSSYYNRAIQLENQTGRKISGVGIANHRKMISEKERLDKEANAATLRRTKLMANSWRESWKQNVKKKNDFEKQQNQLTRQKELEATQTFAARLNQAMKTAFRYFVAYRVLYGIGDAIKNVGSELLDVQKTMYQISGITKESISSTNSLVDSIYRMGTTYGIAIKDATEFTFQMAKMGKSTKEINQLADATAGLSVILGESMVDSGRLIVTTLNQFRLTTSDAARVAGVFNDVISGSPMDIDKLTTAMQYVGNAASAAGVSIEQAGEYIKKLSNLGLKASKIGTGIRNVILAATKDGSNFADKMDELSKKGITLSEAWTMFGKRGAIAGYDLIQNWNEIKKEIDKIPTSIEQVTQAVLTSENETSKLMKMWNNFKETFSWFSKHKQQINLFPTNETNKNIYESTSYQTKHALTMVNEVLDNLNVNKKQAYEILYGKGGITKLMSTLESSGVKLKEYQKNELNYYGGILASFKKQESDTNSARKELDGTLASWRNSLINRVKEQKITVEDALKENKRNIELYKGLLTDFAGISNKTAEELAKAQKTESENLIKSAFSPNALKDARDNLKKWNDLVAKLSESAKDKTKYTKEQISNFESDKKKAEAALQEYCDAGWVEFCVGKKYKTSLKKVALQNAKETRIYLEELRAAIRKQLALNNLAFQKKEKGLNKYGTLSTQISDELSGIFSPKQFFQGKNGKQFAYNKKEYTAYIKQVFHDIYEQIKTDVAENKKAITLKHDRDVTTESLGLTSLYLRLMGLEMNPEKNKLAISEVNKEIDNVKKRLIDINAKFQKDMKSANQKGVQATDQTKKKENSIWDLIFGSDKTEKEKQLDLIKSTLGEVEKIYNKFAREMSNNRNSYYDSILSKAEETYSKEQDMLSAELDNKLITQGQYNKRVKELQEKERKEKNKIAEEKFKEQKKADIAAALIEGVIASAQAFIQNMKKGTVLGIPLSVVSSTLIAAETAAEVAAISSRKFYPTFESGGVIGSDGNNGGLIFGNSHRLGGVKFNIKNQGAIEAEGGEYIVNKDSTKKYKPILDMINKDRKYSPYSLENGGNVTNITNHYGNGGIISNSGFNINDLISALNTVEMRAYFTNKDLDAAKRNKTMIKNLTQL